MEGTQYRLIKSRFCKKVKKVAVIEKNGFVKIVNFDKSNSPYGVETPFGKIVEYADAIYESVTKMLQCGYYFA